MVKTRKADVGAETARKRKAEAAADDSGHDNGKQKAKTLDKKSKAAKDLNKNQQGLQKIASEKG